MCKDASGNLWIGGHGLYHFKPEEQEFREPAIVDSLPFDLNAYNDQTGCQQLAMPTMGYSVILFHTQQQVKLE